MTIVDSVCTEDVGGVVVVDVVAVMPEVDERTATLSVVVAAAVAAGVAAVFADILSQV